MNSESTTTANQQRNATDALRSRARQQQAIAMLTDHALQEENLQSIFDRAVDLIAETLDVEYSKILELLPGGKDLLLRAGIGWKDGLVGRATVSNDLNSQAGYTLLSNSPIIVEDLGQEKRFHGPSILFEHGVVSGMSLVIRQPSGKVWGVLGLHSTHHLQFTPHDEDFLTAVANVLATAIQRKENQEALGSEDDFRQLSNAIPHLAWMANPDGWIFWYNQRWYEYTGTTPQQMEGWGWQSVHEPKMLPKVLENWKKAIEKGEPFEMTFPLRAADGSYRHFLTRGVPVKDESGKVRRWFGTNTDVSEQFEVEVAAQRWAAVLESSSDAIITKTLDGVITGWNKSAERIFGYSAAEIIGKNVTVLYPDHLISEESGIIRKIKAGNLVDHYETVRRSKDGSLVPVSLTVSPIKDKTGQIVGASNIARDISSQKAYEQKLINQASELEQFAYVASHDLQEPLRKVASYAQLLQGDWSDKLDPTGEKYLEKIVQGAMRMQTLIRNLLDFSRLNQLERQHENISLNEVVNQVLADLENSVKETKAKISVDQLPTIKGEPVRISQLLQNLISNALKFHGDAPPEICIFSTRADNGWTIAVRDNGIGINPKYSDQIFKVFHRLHAKGKYPGTGIGLAICKKIAEQHGGRIWLEQTPGGGSTFCVWLPGEAA